MAKPTKPGRKMNSMADKVRQKAKEAEFAGGSDTLRMKEGTAFFKPKKGNNDIIIVPFTVGGKNLEDIPVGDLWYRCQIYKHFKIGVDEKAIVCPRTVGKKCPICEHRAQLMKQGRDSKDEEVSALAPKKRELYNVIDLKDQDSGIKVWEISYHNFGKKLEEEIREAPDDGCAAMFADPDEGAILTVRMSETSMGSNKFLEASRIDFVERGEVLDDDTLAEATQFCEALVIIDYDTINKMYLELDDSPTTDEEDPEEDGQPKRGKRYAARKEAEPEEDPEEEPTPPKRRYGSKATQPVEDEQDEDSAPTRRNRTKPTPEPEDDPDEAPPARTRRRAAEPEPEEAPVKRRRTPDPEEDPTPPKKATGKKAPPPAEEDELDCPHGGTFGEDCDEESMAKHCNTCDFWAECRDAADELEKAAAATPKKKK